MVTVVTCYTKGFSLFVRDSTRFGTPLAFESSTTTLIQFIMQVRKPSLRTHVTKLGLRCQNHDRMGKLSFPAHSTEHAMWMAVGAASKDSFAQVIQVVDSFGAQVWIDTNRDALLVADPRTPYTRDFHWPADREQSVLGFG